MRISDWSSDVCSSDLPCSVDIADHLADGPVLLGRQRLQRLPERLFEGDAGAVATHHDGAFFHRRGHLPTCTAAHGPLPGLLSIGICPRQDSLRRHVTTVTSYRQESWAQNSWKIGRASCRERVGQYV